MAGLVHASHVKTLLWCAEGSEDAVGCQGLDSQVLAGCVSSSRRFAQPFELPFTHIKNKYNSLLRKVLRSYVR